MKKIILISMLLITIIGYAQTHVYDISSRNKHLGNLTVNRTKVNDVYQIEAVSNVNFKFFIKIVLSYKLNCTYKENELLFSSVTTYVNGKVNSTLKTEKQDQFYEVTKNGRSSKYIDNIGMSGALSYYEEPLNMSTIYSDFYGYDKNLELIGPHVYKVTNPKNGQISEYYYEDGILKKAIIHHFLMTFKLQLVSQI